MNENTKNTRLADGSAMQFPPPLEIVFEKMREDAVIPTFSKPGDAAMDLTAIWFEKKDFTVIAHTGIKVKLPKGFYAQVCSRSGLASRGVLVVNAPGIIDSEYRGEIMVILGSVTGQAPFVDGVGNRSCQCGNSFIKYLDRVAQLVIAPMINLKSVEGTVENDTERGDGGLGSTGN